MRRRAIRCPPGHFRSIHCRPRRRAKASRCAGATYGCPALAGIKHCNRLEHVLARAEWGDPAIHGGLLCSAEGDVICATAANLFVLRDGRWTTPAVDRCGVAGVCRGWAIERLAAVETRFGIDDVETADAVFVCNAVRGILPVARLGGRSWPPHPQVQALRQRLAAEHPAFAMESL